MTEIENEYAAKPTLTRTRSKGSRNSAATTAQSSAPTDNGIMPKDATLETSVPEALGLPIFTTPPGGLATVLRPVTLYVGLALTKKMDHQPVEVASETPTAAVPAR